MPTLANLVGQKFGKLTVLQCVGRKGGKSLWRCSCKCGKSADVCVTNLRLGVTKSCGCRQREIASEYGKKNKRHGMRNSKEYHAWRSMIARCYNKNNASYQDYGQRGIQVCQAWRDSFEEFFADVGPCPSKQLSLDRIEGSRGYEPGNCRWATSIVQNRNRPRANKILTYNGKTQCVTAWAKDSGILKSTLFRRLKKGWSAERALFTPSRSKYASLSKKRIGNVTPLALFAGLE